MFKENSTHVPFKHVLPIFVIKKNNNKMLRAAWEKSLMDIANYNNDYIKNMTGVEFTDPFGGERSPFTDPKYEQTRNKLITKLADMRNRLRRLPPTGVKARQLRTSILKFLRENADYNLPVDEAFEEELQVAGATFDPNVAINLGVLGSGDDESVPYAGGDLLDLSMEMTDAANRIAQEEFGPQRQWAAQTPLRPTATNIDYLDSPNVSPIQPLNPNSTGC